MHWRQCEQSGDALVDHDDDEVGDRLTLRIPWEHRHHWIGWGGRPRVVWKDRAGKDRVGIESARGPKGIRAYDEHGVEHLLPHGAYELRPGPARPLRKAAKPIPAGARWITVHPHGPGTEGQAILIEPAGDGTHRVIGGAGGKLNHLRLKNVKSPEEYAADKAERDKGKREADKARRAGLSKEDRAREKAEKEERAQRRQEAERKVVEVVRDKLGGVSDDLSEEDLKGLSDKVRKKLERQHHRKQFREAMKRREQVVTDLSKAELDKVEDREAVKRALSDPEDDFTDANSMLRRELELVAEEEAQRKAARKPSLPKARTDQVDRAAERTRAAIEELDRDALTAERDQLADPKKASDAMARDAANYRVRARILFDAAEGDELDDEAFSVVEEAIRKGELDENADRDTVAAYLRNEAAIELTRAQVADADRKRFEDMEDLGDGAKAWKQVAGKALARGLADEVREAADRLGLRDRDRCPLKQAEAAELMEVLREVDRLRDLAKDFDEVTADADKPLTRDKSRRAFELTPEAPPEHIVEQVQERVLRELAQRLTRMASPGRPEHVQAVVDGHASQLMSLSLAVSRTAYVDRDILDAIGLKNASLLMRHAMEADGHDAGAMLEALEKHHVDKQPEITLHALETADAFLPHIEETLEHVEDFEHAALQLDAAEEDLRKAQQVVGQALGKMEATATLAQAFRQNLPDTMEIDAPRAGVHAALLHLQALGLQPGDYEVDTGKGKVSIKRTAWDKLVHRDDPEIVEQRKVSDEIKKGEHDEEGWLPAGFVSRSEESFTRPEVAHSRFWEPVDMGSKNMREALVDHIGARLTNGERPGDIEKDLLSESIAKGARDPAEFRKLVTELFPRRTEEDRQKLAENDKIRAERKRLQAEYGKASEAHGRASTEAERNQHMQAMEDTLSQLGALQKEHEVPERNERDFHDHYRGLAKEYLARKHPEAGELHSRSLREGATDEQLREAVFRMVAGRPAARSAFTPLDQLTNADRQALQAHFYDALGISETRDWGPHFDKALDEAIARKRKHGKNEIEATSLGGGLLGGGAIQQEKELSRDTFGELNPKAAKELATLYPREADKLFRQAMGERPAEHTGPSHFSDEIRQELVDHIEAHPGKSAAEVAQTVTRNRARRAAIAELGLDPEEVSQTRQLAKLGENADKLEARATKAGLDPEIVKKAVRDVAKLEAKVADYERKLGIIRPDHVAKELGGKIWDEEVGSFERHQARQGTPWSQFVDMHGDLGSAYQALQDEVRGKALDEFRGHYEKVTGNPLTTTNRDIRNAVLHAQGMAEPSARKALMLERKKEVDASRVRGQKGDIDPETGAKIGGRFLEGKALERYKARMEGAKAAETRQGGFFSADAAKASESATEAPTLAPSMFAAKKPPPAEPPSMFGAPKPPPPATVLKEARDPRAIGKGERTALGDRAEAEIESLIGGGLTDAVDPRTERGPTKEGYSAGNLFHGASMDGKRVEQQRTIKLVKSMKRLGAWLGTGAGKTSTSIGAFTELHNEGAASHGLFLVPSAVQSQFPEEMTNFTEPGRYKFKTGQNADHGDRVGMLKDKSTHMRVLTHQSFAQSVLKLAADHNGIAPEAMEARLREMPAGDRAQALRDVFDAHGIPKHFTYVDEAHTLTTRKGNPESLQALIIGAATHPINSPHALFGTGTPHKNDESEVYSMASLVDPDRYSDRAAFVANHGEGMAGNPDAIRRELAHRTFTARIDPPTQRIATENPTLDAQGNRVAGGPIKLAPEHQARVDAVEEAWQRASKAHSAGTFDTDAIRTLNPGRFEGVPEEEHAKIAAELTPHAGILRETAMRRAINQAPPGQNSKLDAMHRIIEHDTKNGRQSVVFTDSLEEARLIHEHLEKSGISAGLYHGGLTGDARDDFRRDFKQGKLRVGVMTSAGEAGINMQTATVIHHYDVPQTMKSHQQRTGRAHRQGQTKDVDVHDWHTDTDYEKKARQRLREKARLADVFETPLGAMDEHGFGAEYQAILNQRHAAADVEGMALAAK